MKQRTVMAWSSGKDSAYALSKLAASPSHELVGLLTIYSAHERVFMHAVPPHLVAAQASAVGLPVSRIDLPASCSAEQYEQLWVDALVAAKANGVTAIAFGDLFLPDVREHREVLARRAGIEPVFPIWIDDRDTARLAAEMVQAGVSAIITCADPSKVPRALAGKRWEELVASSPPGVDPCGEMGEFHTFATACGAFRAPIDVAVHGVVERDGFVFADLR